MNLLPHPGSVSEDTVAEDDKSVDDSFLLEEPTHL